MDKKGLPRKAENLLEQPVYRKVTSDHTGKYNAKLINILRRIK